MPEPESQILIYQPEGGRTRIDVRLEDETVWLTQAQMAELFQTTPQNITLHIKMIYEEAEAEEQATCKHYLQVQQEGERKVRRSLKHYNLEVIIAVGYRVRSHRGTQFRRWATERLRDYLVKGFAMDDVRLKEGRNLGADYFDELLERIRDIRASEKRFYRKIQDIYTLAIDYESTSDQAKLFFKTVQNKLHWATHGHTAAELIVARADADKPNMGLTYFKGSRVRKGDGWVPPLHGGTKRGSLRVRCLNARLADHRSHGFLRETKQKGRTASNAQRPAILTTSAKSFRAMPPY